MMAKADNGGTRRRKSRSLSVRFVHWQEGDAWLGYLEEFPDYWTQGANLEDLREHLRDLHHDLTAGVIPNVRRVSQLKIA
jgi:hypothetical protein